jgi:hypothetical protein
VYSNYNGYYEIEDPDQISGIISCEKSGYHKKEQAITAPSEGTLTVNFSLNPVQESKIAGNVTDAFTGLGIGSALITWVSQTTYSLPVTGYYEIEDPILASGYITCQASGYVTAEQIITAPSEGTLTVNFMMLPSSVDCTESDFEPGGTECWNYNGTGGCYTSAYMTRYCNENGMHKLTAYLDTVGNMLGPYDEPRTMTYEAATAGWEAGYIWLSRYCEGNGKYYFCRYSCTLVEV